MKMFVCTLLLLTTNGIAPLVAQQPALPDLQARVARNDPEAELELGRAYHLGQGVPKDFVKAANLYRQAAAQGNAKAMYNLGYIYHHAQGVPQDDVTAQKWFQQAADKGLPAAELEVGLAYFHGDGGLKQDFAAAAKWLFLAAQPTTPQPQQSMAANALGNLYEHGSGLPQDGTQAVFWYTQAANAGQARAMANLGRIYSEGLVIKKDPVKSYMWTKLAMYLGDPAATHLFLELLAAKKFTKDQIAQGDQMAQDFKLKHPRTANFTAAPPKIVDPEVLKAQQANSAAAAPRPSPASTGASTPAPVPPVAK